MVPDNLFGVLLIGGWIFLLFMVWKIYEKQESMDCKLAEIVECLKNGPESPKGIDREGKGAHSGGRFH